MRQRKSFQKGDRFIATVEEVLSDEHIIFSHEGSLYRAMNSSKQKINAGHKLDMVVIRLEPLQVQLYSDYVRSLNRYA